jgi:hypothetical protein
MSLGDRVNPGISFIFYFFTQIFVMLAYYFICEILLLFGEHFSFGSDKCTSCLLVSTSNSLYEDQAHMEIN